MRCRPTLSYQRLQNAPPLTDAELHDKIRRSVANKHELQVLESFFIFNKSVFCGPIEIVWSGLIDLSADTY